MKVVIIQPHFLPFAGYFDLMNRADVFVYYDTVQFVHRSWHCRTYITEKGVARWLSAAVKTCNGSRAILKEMEWADNTLWREKMSKRLANIYANCKETDLLEKIRYLVKYGSNKLCNWNIEGCSILASALEIKTQILRSSELDVISGDKKEKIINLCRHLGATHYICGPGSKHYIQNEDFAEFGIEVEWVNYTYDYKIPTSKGINIFPSVLDSILLNGIKATQNSIGL